MIPGSQTLRLVQPTRKAVRRTAGRRTTDNVAAGAVDVGRAAAEAPVGVAAGVVAVATFKGAGVNRMATVHVEDLPIRMASQAGMNKPGPSAKERPF
jgi:ABC-type nitrate/sulfonate/bicarbonate transport system substrate-binding protein